MTTAIPILRCISEGIEIVIEATEGRRTISVAERKFLGGIDFNFKNWDVNKASDARPATPVKVYEMIQDATPVQIFDSLRVEKKNLCFTHDQIITFCEKHRPWLREDGHHTLFLFASDGAFFVASVFFGDYGHRVSIHQLKDIDVWNAHYHPHLVVPQW